MSEAREAIGESRYSGSIGIWPASISRSSSHTISCVRPVGAGFAGGGLLAQLDLGIEHRSWLRGSRRIGSRRRLHRRIWRRRREGLRPGLDRGGDMPFLLRPMRLLDGGAELVAGALLR